MNNMRKNNFKETGFTIEVELVAKFLKKFEKVKNPKTNYLTKNPPRVNRPR